MEWSAYCPPRIRHMRRCAAALSTVVLIVAALLVSTDVVSPRAAEGSAGGTRLNAPVTSMAATPDGGVFTYGYASYFGSVPGHGITGQPTVVGIASSPTGSGYWLAGANGAVYSYGDATFLGAPDASHLVAPVSAIATS